jgi:hypothetical protein
MPISGTAAWLPAQGAARCVFRFAFVFDFSKYVIYAFP